MVCRLWGRTELDMIEATEQQQQQLVMETFSLQKVVEMLKEVVVGWREVR